ncbi:DUF4224 domain-containing protein [Marinihelvus fidelis]|uniref:DUF4224 domain-containing protein n=1 Tax=Marinihelvus fidelis TaxID=2613842 RepID=A0A5N0TER6_9GAMM|nr:DUF4224 domain-containing protein [Marinihelvus fidelis]KAA9133490.1 DUF4224 domain-containing protein [Marinihelvus fidelis]
MLITREELQALTGYTRQKEIRDWLAENGIPFRTRPDGWPSLTWRVYEEALLGGRTSRPNFSHLRKAG